MSDQKPEYVEPPPVTDKEEERVPDPSGDHGADAEALARLAAENDN